MKRISKPKWPMHIPDQVRAVHLAMETPECSYDDPKDCPTEKQVARILALGEEWERSQDTLVWLRFVDRMEVVLQKGNELGESYEVYMQAANAGAPEEVLDVLNAMAPTLTIQPKTDDGGAG
jgi:hypothetical protein